MTEPSRPVPTWLSIVGAVGAGVLLVLAFPPYGVWPLSVFAVTLLVLVVGSVSVRMSLGLGLAAGSAFFLGLMPWLRVIGIDAWISLSLLCAAFFVLLALGMTVLRALQWWPLWIALWWVLVEALRERIPLEASRGEGLPSRTARVPSPDGWPSVVRRCCRSLLRSAARSLQRHWLRDRINWRKLVPLWVWRWWSRWQPC